MIEYRPDPIHHPNSCFEFSYQECRQKYELYVAMMDKEFKDHILDILHLSIFICWWKGVSAEVVLSDVGLIHLLVHQLQLPLEKETEMFFPEIRRQFAEICKLSR